MQGEAANVVRAFEDRSLPLEVWRKHATHVLVSTWYLVHLPEAEAIERIRTGIQRYNAAHGIAATPTSGYHETVTVAFIRLIQRELARAPAEATFADRAAAVQARLTGTRVLLEHYTEATLMSLRARREWVEPDLRPF